MFDLISEISRIKLKFGFNFNIDLIYKIKNDNIIIYPQNYFISKKIELYLTLLKINFKINKDEIIIYKNNYNIFTTRLNKEKENNKNKIKVAI